MSYRDDATSYSCIGEDNELCRRCRYYNPSWRGVINIPYMVDRRSPEWDDNKKVYFCENFK